MSDLIKATVQTLNEMYHIEEETIEISEEEYNALSEEEKAEWELFEEEIVEAKAPQTPEMKKAVKTVMNNKGIGDDTHGRYDTERKTQAAARKTVVKAKKVIKKGGGDWKKVAARADRKTERENEM